METERDYIVDFVLGVMKDISTSKPVLFQRDGALFLASPEGFGYVTPGLRTQPEEIRDWEKREQPREIRESVETMTHVKRQDEFVCQFISGEREYVAPISFGPDSNLFNLKDVAASAEKLGNLKDDGKIRLVSHDSGYHSHKYGYACDGIDVWLHSARVMSRETYLEIMRQKEDELLAKLADSESKSVNSLVGSKADYDRCVIPRGIIFTRNLMVSLPLSELFVYDRQSVSSWSDTTELRRERGEEMPSTYHESPYNLHVKLNSVYAKSQTAKEYRAMRTQAIGHIDRELQALEAHMPEAEAILQRFNAIHNKVGAKDMASMREIRRSVRAGK